MPAMITQELHAVRRMPYGLALADHGLEALRADRGLLNGLNVHKGKVTSEAVAESLGLDWVEPLTALG